MLAAFLLGAGALTILDIFFNIMEEVSWIHMWLDLAIPIVSATAVLFTWRFLMEMLQEKQSGLYEELMTARDDAKHWREETAALAEGLGKEITGQFNRWTLTDAEKDVAFLLLKGRSHKEIADIRKTGERTVRQQAASIYQKANLDGRAQLAAFFLENLLSNLPRPADEVPNEQLKRVAGKAGSD